VLSGERLGINNGGYPTIVLGQCHILAFKTFFPEEYDSRDPGDNVLHEDDDKMDFRPHKLRLGTQRENTIDAHYNGCFDGKKSMRVRCVSYIDGVFEKEHDSQSDAMRYLISIGYEKASFKNISTTMNENSKRNIAYGRTWSRHISTA
jgi:hypothetical protein